MPSYKSNVAYKGIQNVAPSRYANNLVDLAPNECVVLEAEFANRIEEGSSPSIVFLEQSLVDTIVANDYPEYKENFTLPLEPVVNESEQEDEGEGEVPNTEGNQEDPPAEASSTESTNGGEEDNGETQEAEGESLSEGEKPTPNESVETKTPVSSEEQTESSSEEESQETSTEQPQSSSGYIPVTTGTEETQEAETQEAETQEAETQEAETQEAEISTRRKPSSLRNQK